MILTVVFYVFIAFTALQICYYLFFSIFLFPTKNNIENDEQSPISIILFAKNSADFLQQNIPSILEQNYPKFEVILINNASLDHTAEVLEALQTKNKNITIINVLNNEAFWGSKKYALTLGIKAAKYENLLFIDVSARPISKNWINEISKNFNQYKSIVLGYEKYRKKGSLINLLMRYEKVLKAIQCFSFAKLGSPFMAFESNFGYTKSEFYKAKGFINHMNIEKGEADLFIKDAGTKNNISFTINKNSFVEIDNPKSFSNWFHKMRISSNIAKHYKFKHLFFLSFFTISKILFYVLSTTIFFFYPWKIILPIVISYFLVQYIVFGISTKKLGEPYLIFLLPFLEISLLLIQISIFSANLISKPDHWK